MKRTVAAHAATNCISDFLPDNHATPTEKDQRTFLGVPISVKDCYDYQGRDSTLGYSQNVNRPAVSSSIFVKMLMSAGATLHVKTTVPTGLLALETESDLFGYTPNPYNCDYSVGASTGGGAALLAYRGSKIEIGNDIGGSVRMPAGWCGIYGLKASSGRFPRAGVLDCAPGLDAIKTIPSPMASDLDDLEEFCHRFIDLKPWVHDIGVGPLLCGH
jgi:Asp-tRNA(Asn)/Glu-tRNA(Gln) amidotransferase A subunit family amidase